MRPAPSRAPRLALAALAAAALLPACGPDPEKKELADYELRVEDLMGRDEKFTAELIDEGVLSRAGASRRYNGRAMDGRYELSEFPGSSVGRAGDC